MIKRKKTQHVDLGNKGGFTIKHPGAFRRAAQRASRRMSLPKSTKAIPGNSAGGPGQRWG